MRNLQNKHLINRDFPIFVQNLMKLIKLILKIVKTIPQYCMNSLHTKRWNPQTLYGML